MTRDEKVAAIADRRIEALRYYSNERTVPLTLVAQIIQHDVATLLDIIEGDRLVRDAAIKARLRRAADLAEDVRTGRRDPLSAS